jgi:hypothetical protein
MQMPNATKTESTIFVVRLKADRDDASIRALKWILKVAWRHFHMKCLSVVEEKVEQRERAHDRAA